MNCKDFDFTGFQRFYIDLKLPLMYIKGSKGLLACGYFNHDTFTRTGEACAIVSGVANFDDMLAATVGEASRAAIGLGVRVGVTKGWEALELFR